MGFGDDGLRTATDDGLVSAHKFRMFESPHARRIDLRWSRVLLERVLLETGVR